MRKNSTLIYSLNNLDESENYVFNLDALNPFGISDYEMVENYLNDQFKSVSKDIIDDLIAYSKSSIV
ncbi:hypothetical protein ACFLTE_05765 [Bacteroidota bacterium]